jgi:hypothetical protein
VLRRQGGEGAAQPRGERGVEIALGDAADVVLAKDRGVQLNTSTL